MVTRGKAAQLMVGPLVLLLLAVLWSQTHGGRQPQTTPPPVGPPPPDGDADESLSLPSTPQAPEEGGPWVLPDRNPFERPSTLETLLHAEPPSAGPEPVKPEIPPMPELRIQGVFWGITPARTIINDQILTVGDTFDGVKILAIDETGVEVEYQGNRSTLQLPKPATIGGRTGE